MHDSRVVPNGPWDFPFGRGFSSLGKVLGRSPIFPNLRTSETRWCTSIVERVKGQSRRDAYPHESCAAFLSRAREHIGSTGNI